MGKYVIRKASGEVWNGHDWTTDEAGAKVMDYVELPRELESGFMVLTDRGPEYVDDGDSDDLSDARLIARVEEVE